MQSNFPCILAYFENDMSDFVIKDATKCVYQLATH